jgi:gamma-F420-2:alpha-L-glutamate ligase
MQCYKDLTEKDCDEMILVDCVQKLEESGKELTFKVKVQKALHEMYNFKPFWNGATICANAQNLDYYTRNFYGKQCKIWFMRLKKHKDINFSLKYLLEDCYIRGICTKIFSADDIICLNSRSCKQLLFKKEKVDFPLLVVPRMGATADKDDLNVLSYLQNRGVRIFNEYSSCGKAKSKRSTINNLFKEVPVPNTLELKPSLSINDKIDHIYQHINFPCIIKEESGSKGEQVHKANNQKEAVEILTKLKDVPSLAQECVGIPGTDIRVFIIGDKVVAKMLRKAKTGWKSNLFQGGVGENITYDDKYSFADGISLKAKKLIGLEVCGVDVLFDTDESGYVVKKWICEINASPGLEGITKYTGINVAHQFIEYLY